MKDYEIYSNLKVPKNSNIVIRLDGRKFHSLAKYLDLEKPYDCSFSRLMSKVSLDIFNQFSPRFVYTFSDEISILLDEIPFLGRAEKLDSVFSSVASGSFTYHLLNEFREDFDIDGLSENDRSVIFPVSFDSRIVPLVKEDIYDYFKWRQDESWRNCINAYGIWALRKEFSPQVANEKIKGLKSSEIHELLFKKGINLNDVDTWKKRGIGLYKIENKIDGFNPVKNEKTVSSRSEVYIDYELDLFNKDYFNRFFKG